MSLRRTAIALALLLAARPAHGLIIDQGLTTLDTDTGLEWLDVTESLFFTFAEIESGAGGFAADGWHHATTAEVCDFFAALSGRSFACPGDLEFSPSLVANRAVSLIGDTGLAGQSSVRLSHAFFDTGTVGVGLARIEYHRPDATSFFSVTENLSPRDAEGAHLLVRAVPEPRSTLWLVGTAILTRRLARSQPDRR